MPSSDPNPEILARLEELRQQLSRVREEQQQLAQAVNEMLGTFRRISVQLGIASEPYRPKNTPSKPSASDPGFG
jgi:hypothetical protein